VHEAVDGDELHLLVGLRFDRRPLAGLLADLDLERPGVVQPLALGLKEFGEPTRKALIMDLAPEERKAATFGLYYLIRDVIVSVAAFGGALLWDPSTARVIADNLHLGGAFLPFFDSVASPTTNFLAAVGFGVAGTIYFAMFGRDLGPAATPAK
jgi:hypothetical protein